jgi:hypothetical protein
MNKHFVLFSLESLEKPLTAKMRKTLDRAIDWIEITPSSWLLWTSTSSSGWLKRFRETNISFENIFIVEVNPADRAGMMPQAVWDFIQKRHE